MVFIQFVQHTVPAAWSKGIEDILKTQQNVDYELLDGQAKADVQISHMTTAINQGVDVIFLQPVDSVGIGPSIKKAREAGISVITLNIDFDRITCRTYRNESLFWGDSDWRENG